MRTLSWETWESNGQNSTIFRHDLHLGRLELMIKFLWVTENLLESDSDWKFVEIPGILISPSAGETGKKCGLYGLKLQ
jgi:hypothetical protein